MKINLTSVRIWWHDRAPREQVLLCVMGAILVVWLGVNAVWQPLRAARVSLSDQIARHERALAVLASDPVPALPAMVNDGRPLNGIITDTTTAFQLTIRRLEPDGPRIRVTLDEASFDAVILWLEAVIRDQGLRVSQIDLTRRPAPGVVSATLTLER